MVRDRDRALEVEIAAAWRAATADIAYIPLPADKIRERFEQLAAGALDALAAERPLEEVLQRGRAIGRKLISLNLRKPIALEQTLTCLSAELKGGAPERLSWLLAGIAGGFSEAAESDLLKEQEMLGRAATYALRHAQAELRTSRDDLAKTNRELSAQINERIRAEATQRQYAGRLQRLHEIDLVMLSAESLPAIVDVSIDYIRHLIKALTVTIFLIDTTQNRLVVLNSSSPIYPTGRNMPITMMVALARLEAGEDIYIADLNKLQDRTPAVNEIVARGGRSMLVVPLHYRDELIGGLTIVLDEVREFTAEETTIAHEIADSVTVAIQNRRLLEAEQEAHYRELTLREAAASLTLGLTPAELSRRILNMLGRVIDFRGAALMLLENGDLNVAARHGESVESEHIGFILAQRPRSIWSVIETRRPVIINDTEGSPDWVLLRGFEYIRAWMGVPLLVKGECIGVLAVDRDEPDAFSDSDRDLVIAFANQAAIAIENGRLYTRQQTIAAELARRYRERERELDVLYGITVTAVSNPDLESLLERSLELAIDAFGGTAAAVFLIDGKDSELELSAVVEPSLPISGVLREWVANNPDLWPPPAGTLHILTNSDLPAGWPDELGSALAILALRSSGFDLGLFCLACDSADRLTDETMPLLATVVDQIAVAVENIRLRQVARQTAIIEERERLAREIHDSVTQSIYSVGLFAGAALGAVEAGDAPKAQERIQSILDVTNLSMRELRLLLFELRTESLARLGIVEALRERLHIVESRAGVQGEVRADLISDLPISIEETYYRVALEALNNSLRHAQAQHVTIRLMEEDGHLVMSIADDGVGFDRAAAAGAGGMGLESMQKRVSKVSGVLTLTSQIGGGTVVSVRAPLQ